MHTAELHHQAEVLQLQHRAAACAEQEEWQQMEILMQTSQRKHAETCIFIGHNSDLPLLEKKKNILLTFKTNFQVKTFNIGLDKKPIFHFLRKNIRLTFKTNFQHWLGQKTDLPLLENK